MKALQIKHSLAKPAVVEMPNPIDTANVDTHPRETQDNNGNSHDRV